MVVGGGLTSRCRRRWWRKRVALRRLLQGDDAPFSAFELLDQTALGADDDDACDALQEGAVSVVEGRVVAKKQAAWLAELVGTGTIADHSLDLVERRRVA